MKQKGKIMELLDRGFSAYHFLIKSPLSYKTFLFLTLIFISITIVYSVKLYRDNERFHDFFMPNIRVFVDKEFNERVLSFELENLSEVPVYVDQIRLVIYNNNDKTEPIYNARKYGPVNPLKSTGKLDFFFTLDSPAGMGFNLTDVIKNDEYMMQAYKFIIVVYYSKESLKGLSEQRFEHIYKVMHNDSVITGIINEVPSQRNESDIINRANVPYEVN